MSSAWNAIYYRDVAHISWIYSENISNRKKKLVKGLRRSTAKKNEKRKHEKDSHAYQITSLI